jgi:hypothetical protein
MFVAEYAAVHTQQISAYNVDQAAAVARATAQTYGYKLLGIYPQAVFDEIEAQKTKGQSINPKGGPDGGRAA